MHKDSFNGVTELCKEAGFHKRGKAFFRLHGDGILQVLKYAPSVRPYQHVDLMLGLFSLYGEMELQWLTDRGCIPRYQTHWLENGMGEEYRRTRMSCARIDELKKVECYDVNLKFLQYSLLPFLDGVDSQQKLAEAIMFLDQKAQMPTIAGTSRDIRWNDMLKFAPFLHIGDFKNAERVIQSIIDQHEYAKKWREDKWPREQYEEYLLQTQDEERKLQNLKEIAASADKHAADCYLQDNYQRNITMVKFKR